MVSGINLDLLKESGKDPFGVCQTGVCSNAFSMTDVCVGYTRNTVAFRTSFLHDHDFRCA